MKVAIVHDYLNVYGGGEALMHAIWELYPDADIYTAEYDADAMAKAGAFRDAKIHYPKWKNSIPGKLKKFAHQILIANLPFYFSRLDLSEYDLVISSTAHFAKGVQTRDDQTHVSYVHTPPRFLYGYKGALRKRSIWYWKLILWPLDTYLRYMDQKFAKRPDYLICNSEEVRSRIKRIYRRDAKVINPFPQVSVSDQEFQDAKQNGKNDYYLIISRLAAYKNIDLAINTLGNSGRLLKIAGTGPESENLRKLVSQFDTVEMLGFVSEEEKKNLYRNCKAFLATVKDEDFGMAPLEPMMYGKPVIALRQGGYLETMIENKTGVFFDALTPDALLDAINHLDEITLNPDEIRRHAMTFNKERFQQELREYIKSLLK